MRLRRRGRNHIDDEPAEALVTGGLADPYLIRPRVAQDLIEVGRRLAHGESVLLDLGALTDPVKRRMLDACAGLVYGLDASMTWIMTDRYRLQPPSKRQADSPTRTPSPQRHGRENIHEG